MDNHEPAGGNYGSASRLKQLSLAVAVARSKANTGAVSAMFGEVIANVRKAASTPR
jgi:hypothetical protein